MKLSQLPVGALVKDPDTKYNNDVIIWQVLEHGHTGDPSGSTTLQSRDILTLKCFDAKEPSNSDNYRKQYGNNRYKYSNILQWLNSDKNSWYEAQHTYDQEPSSSYVSNNAYDSEAGFLTNFSDQFKNALLTASKTTVLATVDGGGSETVESKVFPTSTTEVGLANENNIAEGSIYSLYNTASYRLKNLFNDAAKGDYTYATSPWSWWLRTPNSGYSYNFRDVYTDGTLSGYTAYSGYGGISPALCISSDTEVSDTPDASNVYTLQFAPSCVKAYIGDENGEAKLIWGQEHEIEALVPVMTSNTTPSGEVLRTSDNTGSPAWKAFDGDDGTYGLMSATNLASNAESILGYHFTNPVNVKRVSFSTQIGSQYSNTGKIQYSDDGTTWTDATEEFNYTSANNPVIVEVPDCGYHLYWILRQTYCANGTSLRGYYTLQFYGY